MRGQWGERWRRGAQRSVLASAVVLLGACTGLRTLRLEADASMLPVGVGNTGVHGIVTLVERADGVQVTYDLQGLPPNSTHALAIHEQGNCDALDASSAGPVFSPNATRLRRGARPDGALGTVRADLTGVATGFLVERNLTLDGVNSVVGRAVIVHRDDDLDNAAADLGAGPALACGVLRTP